MKSCPWCHEEVAGELPVDYREDHNVTEQYRAHGFYFAYCPACGAAGPRCKTKEAALAAWDKREV